MLLLIWLFVATCCLIGIVKVLSWIVEWLSHSEADTFYLPTMRPSTSSRTAPPPKSPPTFIGGTGKATSSRSASSDESGLFSSSSVSLLLVTGAALFIFSVYLFVRSYWDSIPNEVKLASLNLLTALVYSVGYYLSVKKLVPRTAKTLVFLGLAVLPSNVYAANVLVFHSSLSVNAAWAFGCALMLPASLLTLAIFPSLPVGMLIGASVEGLFYFGSLAYGLSLQGVLNAVALSAAILLLMVALMSIKEEVGEGIFYSIILVVCFDLLRLVQNGFFIDDVSQIYTVSNLFSLGVVFAVLARALHPSFAYGASAFFLGASALLLKHLHVPIYEYGYCFVPVGIIALLRAWTFQRSGRAKLARPYYWLGQMALLISSLCIIPVFNLPRTTDSSSLMVILLATMMAYAVAGAFYRDAIFTYASALVVFYFMGLFVWEQNFDFNGGILAFSTLGCVMIVSGSIGQSINDRQVGYPLTFLGLLSLTLAMSFMAGQWGDRLYTSGTLIDTMTSDQLRAGFWTGSMSAIAYVLVALLRKRASLLYPALFSVTWIYVCWLQKMGAPLTLYTASWIVVVSMAASYMIQSIRYPAVARCFSLWGGMAALFIASAALYVQTPMALSAAILCTLAFAPAIGFGDPEAVMGFLMGAYLTHFLWFRQSHAGPFTDQLTALYSLQLVAINFGVVFLRTVVTFFRPQNNIEPYRFCALAFTLVSMVLSFADLDIAWQVFLAYGLLAIAVSVIHYQGRYIYVGAFLLLASAELFFASQKLHYIELYTLPPAVLLLWAGHGEKAHPETRDFLYGTAAVLLYLPSSVESLREMWEWHGIFLGIASLLGMLYGMHQKNKLLTFSSAFVLVANGFVQSRQFFLTMPRWVYLGTGGLTLIALGGIFEFQREALTKMKHKVVSSFEGWS